MAPDTTGRAKGQELPVDGTSCGDECVVCHRRFSNRYWIDSRGPYCATHADQVINSIEEKPT